jgi:5-methylcytosine-specific restriction endonuclease McrA
MKRVLLLNSAYEPLKFIDPRNAIRLVLRGAAEPHAFWDDDEWKSERARLVTPAVLRLHRYVPRRCNPRRFNKHVMFNRDGFRCQYCGTVVNSTNVSIEHVHPQSRGGETSFLNCVTACRPCNRRKASRTLVESGMALLSEPRNPSPDHYINVTSRSVWHPSWDTWFH